MRYGGTDEDMLEHVRILRDLLVKTMEIITRPYMDQDQPRIQKWTQNMITERSYSHNVRDLFIQTPRIMPAHPCLKDDVDIAEEMKEGLIDDTDQYGLEYLPTVVGGKPICITTDWATSAFFDPKKYFYVNVKGTHNCLYYCLALVIFRDVDKLTYLEKLFTDYFSCDVMLWTLKPKRDYELNLHQMVSKFVISEHLEKLDPPTICPIDDDWKSWGVLKEFVTSKADKIYFQ
jgi:hypothetical protein